MNDGNKKSWPEGAPEGAAYRAWTSEVDEHLAAASFRERYGLEPEYIFESRRLLLLGPVPDDLA